MKGICFTEPLFHKVVKGKKTQTRRMINIQPPDNRNWRVGTLMDSTAKADKSKIGKNHYLLLENEYTIKESLIKNCFSPKYKVGEKVYLKEPYSIIADYEKGLITKYKFDYPASFSHKWSNKLFMPESAARYFIEITAVRAERLQDISDEDCIKEGIESFTKDNQLYKFGLDGWDWSKMPRTPREAYAALINRINGKGTWERNPFVWVYDFRLIQE